MNLECLPDFVLDPTGVAEGFVAVGIQDYQAAARYVWDLPYGRNSDRADWRLVLEEGRGTCSTKHALLAQLARDHGHPVELVLGVYEMRQENTPGVGAVLLRYGLDAVPEAHCRLRYRGTPVDLTRGTAGVVAVVGDLNSEERIEPYQIGRYKVERHRNFVRGWAAGRGLDFEHVWRAREECIAAIAELEADQGQGRHGP